MCVRSVRDNVLLLKLSSVDVTAGFYYNHICRKSLFVPSAKKGGWDGCVIFFLKFVLNLIKKIK